MTQTELTYKELAKTFAQILREWLGLEALEIIDIRNHENNDDSCVSHEYCDPNEAMIEALEKHGLEYSQEDEIVRLTNDAWTYGKLEGFAALASR